MISSTLPREWIDWRKTRQSRMESCAYLCRDQQPLSRLSSMSPAFLSTSPTCSRGLSLETRTTNMRRDGMMATVTLTLEQHWLDPIYSFQYETGDWFLERGNRLCSWNLMFDHAT